jgi:hypothetical protein
MILLYCLVKMISRTKLQYLREYRVYFVHGLFLLADIGFRHHYYPTIEANRPYYYYFYRTLLIQILNVKHEILILIRAIDYKLIAFN